MEGDIPEFGGHFAITVTRPVADNLEQLECSSDPEMEPRPSRLLHPPLRPPVNPRAKERTWQRAHVADEELLVRPHENRVWHAGRTGQTEQLCSVSQGTSGPATHF